MSDMTDGKRFEPKKRARQTTTSTYLRTEVGVFEAFCRDQLHTAPFKPNGMDERAGALCSNCHPLSSPNRVRAFRAAGSLHIRGKHDLK